MITDKGTATLLRLRAEMIDGLVAEIERLRTALLKIEQETIDHVAVGIARSALAIPPVHRE